MRNIFVLLLPLVLLLMLASDASAQIFARNRDVNVNANGVAVQVDRRLFGRDRVFVNGARVDNRRNVNRGRDINVAVVDPVAAARVNAAFFNRGVAFAPARFNAFGTFAQQDAFGNVFEVDAFGNARLAGNVFNRGFQGTVFRPSAFAFGSSFAAPSVAVFGSSCH